MPVWKVICIVSNMESTNKGESGIQTDPAADLELLDRAQASVELDQVLDFGPWWYAPVLAAFVAATALFVQDTSSTASRIVWAVAFGAGAYVAWHDYRRRGVRSRPSTRAFAMRAPIALAAFALLMLWELTISTVGYGRFVPGYAVLGWLLTTVLLLGLRSGLHALRNRRVISRGTG